MFANSLGIGWDNHVGCFTFHFLDKRVSQLLVAEPEADVHQDMELGIGPRLNFSEFRRSICHGDIQPYDEYAIAGSYHSMSKMEAYAVGSWVVVY